MLNGLLIISTTGLLIELMRIGKASTKELLTVMIPLFIVLYAIALKLGV